MKSSHEFKMTHFPIFCMFCIFPFISIAVKMLYGIMINYDGFWISMFIFICFSSSLQLNAEYKAATSIIILLIVMKYLVPFLTESLILRAWVMDMKWMIYLITALLWVSKYGIPQKKFIYDCSLFFAVVYILYTLVRFMMRDALSRDGILMESNYDGFMILMGFCFIGNLDDKKRDFIIFSLATLFTMSRTGLSSMAVIVVYKYMKNNSFKMLIVLPIIYFAAGYAMSLRGESSENMDRFVYFQQAFLYFNQTDIFNIIFGSTPGKPLDMYVLPDFSWNVSNFEEEHSLNGVFPFMFHSVYLRLALTWGVPAALCFLFYFIYKFWNCSSEYMKVFCLLIMIQSFSLSTLTIQNVSYLFFVMLLLLLQEEHEINDEQLWIEEDYDY